MDLRASDGFSPLHWALMRETTDMLNHLVSRGFAVDVRSDEGATPLMMACQDERKNEHVRWLLAHGADPLARDSRGFTALHGAAQIGNREVVQLLLAAGADPRAEAQGFTPASLAQQRGHREVARKLGG